MVGQSGGAVRRFRIVTVGQGGNRAIEPLRADDLFATAGGFEVRAIAVGTDASALEAADAERVIYVERPRRGKQGSVRDEVRWRDGLEEELHRTDLCLLVVNTVDPEALEIASVACRIARDSGALTLAFLVGGPPGDATFGVLPLVEADLAAILDAADSTLVVPTFSSSPSQAEALVGRATRALLQISRRPGLLNYSLKDVRETFHAAGLGEIAEGRGDGESRFSDAAQSVLASPTLFRPLRYATSVALHVSAPASAALYDVSELSETVAAACAPDANLWTAVYLDSPDDDSVEVTVIAAGLPRS